MPFPSIPVINIDKLESPTTRLDLDSACREWGFFQVTHHGIQTSTLNTAIDAMRAFFALPNSQKQAISRTSDNPWGY